MISTEYEFKPRIVDLDLVRSNFIFAIWKSQKKILN